MSMTRADIISARREAQNFIKKCDDALDQLNREVKNRIDFYEFDEHKPKPSDYSFGSKQTGALRRSSLDLSRSLSELRK